MGGRFEHLEFQGDGREKNERPEQFGKAAVTGNDYMRQAQEEERLGRWEPALQMYTRCLEISRGTIPAWVGQVQMLVQLTEYAEGRLWSDKALEVFRNNAELLACKAQACIRLGDVRAAKACSDVSLANTGSSPWRWQVRGEVLLATGLGKPDQCFAKSLTEEGSDWYDRVRIAAIYLFYRKPAAACEFARQAVEMLPSAPLAWFVQGQCLRQLSMAGQAAASFKHCMELRPNFPPARRALDEMAQTFWHKLREFLRIRR